MEQFIQRFARNLIWVCLIGSAFGQTVFNPGSGGGGGGSGTVTNIATTSPISGGPITTTGTVSCPTCVTSGASLTNTAIMTGAGNQASQTPNGSTTLDASGNLTAAGTITGASFSSTGTCSVSGSGAGLSCWQGSQASLPSSGVSGKTILYTGTSGLSVSVGTAAPIGVPGVGTCTNQVVTGDNIAAAPTCSSVSNAMLSNSAITIAGTSVSLGGSTSSFPSPGAIGGTTPAAGTFTTLTGTTLNTATNCAATGSAANPSVASCSSAASGSFSCATNASTGTCTVNTSAVTANSVIIVQPDSSLGTKLSVPCNTTADTGLVAPRVSARSASTSFTITLGTFSTNPLCFNYVVIE